MNYITQKNWLEEQLKQFKLFIPYCPTDDLPKLLIEMQTMMFRIEQIRTMTFEEKCKQVIVHYETKQSKINFKTI